MGQCLGRGGWGRLVLNRDFNLSLPSCFGPTTPQPQANLHVWRALADASTGSRDHRRPSYPVSAPPATMFSRSVLRSTTGLTPPCSFASRPLSSVLNCNQSSFLSLRPFHQTASNMSGNTKAFFDVQYAPVGSSARKFLPPFLCYAVFLLLVPGFLGMNLWWGRGIELSFAFFRDASAKSFCFPVQFTLTGLPSDSQDGPHPLQPLREGRPQDRCQLP